MTADSNSCAPVLGSHSQGTCIIPLRAMKARRLGLFFATLCSTYGSSSGSAGRGPSSFATLNRRVPHGRARWTCLTLSVNQPEVEVTLPVGTQRLQLPRPGVLPREVAVDQRTAWVEP